MRKKTYFLPTIVGFVIFYLLSMGLSTYFVSKQYTERYRYECTDTLMKFKDIVSSMDDEYALSEAQNKSDYFKNYMSEMISSLGLNQNPKEYQQFSIALYAPNGDKIAQSGSYLSFVVPNYFDCPVNEYAFSLNEYFTKAEIKQLAQYYTELSKNTLDMDERTVELYMHGTISKETEKLISLGISDDFTGAPDTVINNFDWTWENSSKKDSDDVYSIGSLLRKDLDLVFPYLSGGKENYEKWLSDDFLQNHPDQRLPNTTSGSNKKESLFTVHDELTSEFLLSNSSPDSGSYLITLRSTSQPLSAAINSLKHVYINSFLIMFLCILIIIYSVNRIQKRREELEVTRRSYTNAIALKLKAPLDTIRKQAEVLQQDTMMMNSDACIEEIIKQTEDIDEMIQKMIFK